MPRTTPDTSPSPTKSTASGRRTRATARFAPGDGPRGWTGGDVGPDRVGLYRRFTMGAAKQGWRLRPDEIELLLDVYVAYVRQDVEPTPERCLRVLKRLRRRNASA